MFPVSARIGSIVLPVVSHHSVSALSYGGYGNIIVVLLIAVLIDSVDVRTDRLCFSSEITFDVDIIAPLSMPRLIWLGE